jgi:hypothetical protein
MPYEIRRKGSRYQVVNSDTGEIHAHATTKAKAEKQLKLLRGVEHGWTPTNKPGVYTRKINGRPVRLRVQGGVKHGAKR